MGINSRSSLIGSRWKSFVGAQALIDRTLWLLVAGAMLLVPLVVSGTAKNSFRLPKEMLFRACAIAIAALIIYAILLRPSQFRPPRSGLFAVLGAAIVWGALTTLSSTNRLLSAYSLLNLTLGAVYLAGAYLAARRRFLTVLYVAFVPAAINAVLTFTQRLDLWKPIPVDDPSYTGRLAAIGLLGNPDDVGMFLVAPLLAALALALTSPGSRRITLVTAVILTAGLLASETLGAIGAAAVGIFVMFISIRPRWTIAMSLLAALLALAILRASPQRWSQARDEVRSAIAGDIDPLLSGRLPAFLAAWRMFREHPFAGVGLGCFPFHYFDAKIAVEMEHPFLINRNVASFRQAHSEHLQILAEGGFVAYAIFLGMLFLLSRISFTRGAPNDPRAAFARRLAFPLAAGIFTLALTGFPFRLAAPSLAILFVVALVAAWSELETA